MTRKTKSIGTGVALEARVQRLFMCQGAFAERGLLLRPARAATNLVSDVDVVAHDYRINFHHARIYAECKGGAVSTLDRVVWVRGMMSVLAAERGYLVLDHCSRESSSFASSHGVEILQETGLNALESALRIGRQFWPGRANFFVYEPLQLELYREIDSQGTRLQRWLGAAAEIWREASALSFSYGRLNQLLAVFEEFAAILTIEAPPVGKAALYHHSIAALVVRLSQYVLFAAAETLGMTKTEREEFIGERLASGSLGFEQTRKMMRSALELAKAKLREHRIDSPPNWDAEHLVAAPRYARSFAEVVDRVVGDGHRARMLPITLELRLFGYAGEERNSSGLIKRVSFALPLSGLIRGFVVQSLGVPDQWTHGPVVTMDKVKVITDNGGFASAEPAALPGIS